MRDAPKPVEYVVLSLGTGELNVRIRYEEARRWGSLHWARPLIDIAYDGSSDTVDGQMRQLMHVVKHPYLYYRFQPSLSEANNALDDTSDWNIQDLKRRAASIFDDPEKLEKIENLCRLLRTANRRVEGRIEGKPTVNQVEPDVSWCRRPRACSRPRAAAPSGTSGSPRWC